MENTPGRTLVSGVDFAVPGHYDIGDRFPSWDEAVQHAREKIVAHRYPGQKIRPSAMDYHPRRFVQDGNDLVVYTRAFVHMRIVEPIQDRPDSGVPSGSDHVAMTWEVFQDGAIETRPS